MIVCSYCYGNTHLQGFRSNRTYIISAIVPLSYSPIRNPSTIRQYGLMDNVWHTCCMAKTYK